MCQFLCTSVHSATPPPKVTVELEIISFSLLTPFHLVVPVYVLKTNLISCLHPDLIITSRNLNPVVLTFCSHLWTSSILTFECKNGCFYILYEFYYVYYLHENKLYTEICNSMLKYIYQCHKNSIHLYTIWPKVCSSMCFFPKLLPHRSLNVFAHYSFKIYFHWVMGPNLST